MGSTDGRVLTLQRTLYRRSGEASWDGRVTEMLQRVLGGLRVNRQGWRVAERDEPERIETADGAVVWRTRIVLRKDPSNRPSTEPQQYREIKQSLEAYGRLSRHGSSPVLVLEPHQVERLVRAEPVELTAPSVVDYRDIHIPDVLRTGEDWQVERYPAVSGIYGRAGHIRMIFTSLHAALRSDFRLLNHMLLEGPPGSAKSAMKDAVKTVVGPGGYHEFNASALTAAGLQATFLRQYRDADDPSRAACPPVLIFEELETASEAVAEILLKMTDSDREVRKTSHAGNDVVAVRAFCLGLINDRDRFERLAKGALNRRFSRKIYVPLPNRQLIERILQREAERLGGNERWVDACLTLMDETGSSDATEIISWLEGGDRLLDGSYQQDVLTTRRGYTAGRTALEAAEQPLHRNGVVAHEN